MQHGRPGREHRTRLCIDTRHHAADVGHQHRIAGLVQLHSHLGLRLLSLGLQYRVPDGDLGSRTGTPGDIPYRNGYSLASSRFSGAAAIS